METFKTYGNGVSNIVKLCWKQIYTNKSLHIKQIDNLKRQSKKFESAEKFRLKLPTKKF